MSTLSQSSQCLKRMGSVVATVVAGIAFVATSPAMWTHESNRLTIPVVIGANDVKEFQFRFDGTEAPELNFMLALIATPDAGHVAGPSAQLIVDGYEGCISSSGELSLHSCVKGTAPKSGTARLKLSSTNPVQLKASIWSVVDGTGEKPKDAFAQVELLP